VPKQGEAVNDRPTTALSPAAPVTSRGAPLFGQRGRGCARESGVPSGRCRVARRARGV